MLAGLGLKELPKFFDFETRVTNDTAHCVCINGIMSWDCENASPVTHDDVLCLVDDIEARFFKCSDSAEMINSRKLGHDYAGTSTSRSLEPFEILTAASRYSRIAS